jgi:hypothetical protein
MSETGQSRQFDDVRVTSAFPPIAAKAPTSRDVSNVPLPDSAPQQQHDHLVGGTSMPIAFAVLRFDNEFEFCRLLNRQINWLSALQNLVNDHA